MKIFKRKNKERKDTPRQVKEKIIEIKFNIPKICALNFNSTTTIELKKRGYNIFEGSLGKKIKIQNTEINKGITCRPNPDFPNNIHEFDILLIDLIHEEITDFKPWEHSKEIIKESSDPVFFCKYPQTLFDPTGISLRLLDRHIDSFVQKDSLIILFANQFENYKYIIGELQNNYLKGDYFDQKQELDYSNYFFLYDWPIGENISGNNILISDDIRDDLKKIINRHISSIQYHITFNHPKVWNGEKEVYSKEFKPLIQNIHNDIISYYTKIKKTHLFVFPEFDNQSDFINDFLENIAPDIVSSIFPHSEKLLWKEREEYFLPNHLQLLRDKQKIENEYKEKIKQLNIKIDKNKLKFSFLHQILTSTGDELVNNVKQFLEWLGYSLIINVDDTNPNIKEEDLRIEIENGLIIIEIKGINGTSKDSDCNQVSKIRYRRIVERKKTDVRAIYIVNHQRYKAPIERKNPPFTENQIRDAENDDRGLLTTWQLFNLYFDIEKGIVTKEEARNAIIKKGLVEFKPPNLIFVNEVNEVFNKKGFVIILNLSNTKIKKGDALYVERKGKFTNRVNVLNIKYNGKDVEEIENGEIGLKLNKEVKLKSKIWIKKL